jgi:acyl CoA:acetate/3-ketoacid CoA transferase beta subunit
LSSQGIPELEAYADDYDFLEDVREACKDPKALDEWVRRWVLQPQTQEAYLAALGKDRVGYLKGKARSDSWFAEILEHAAQGIGDEAANATERMVVAAARKMAEIVEARQYRTILAGVGAANLASWLAHRALRDKGYDVEVMAEIGFYGFAPRPADPFIFNYRNMPTCKMLADIETVMGQLVSGANHRNLGAMGAGQVDRWGNLNSTAVPGKTLLVGSGGANDVASGSNETLVVVNQERSRFVDRVPYITSPGARVRTVVSDLGVFEKDEGKDELRLTAILAESEGEEADPRVRQIQEHCGWDLKVREPLRVLPPAPPDLLFLLRCYDPKGQFLGKNRS